MEYCHLESLIAKLSSIDAISSEDSLWSDVTALPKCKDSLTRAQEQDLDILLAPLSKQFIIKNCTSGNLGCLIKLCLEKCEEAKRISITSIFQSFEIYLKYSFFSLRCFRLDLSHICGPLSNLLFTLRLICRHFIERMPVEALQRHMSIYKTDTDENCPNDGGIDIESGLDSKLCRALVSILCNIPLRFDTFLL